MAGHFGNSALRRLGGIGGWRVAVMLAMLLLPPGAQVAAQSGQPDYPWKDSFYPYFPSLANDFPLLMIHYEQRKGADYFARTPYAGLFSFDFGASTRGSRQALARLHAPLLVEKWRFTASAGAVRAARFGFFGLGNDTEYDGDLVRNSQPFFYRARRTRYLAEAEVSRRLARPVYLSVAAGVEHSVLSDLPRPSTFRNTFGSSDVEDTDARGRLTLVFDTRDNEYNTTRGLFAQASLTAGSGGDNYTRVSGDLRGYVTVREGTVLAGRVAGSSLSKDAPLNARFEMPVWEGEVSVLGGANSHRGVDYQRFTGRGVLFANAEVRHDLLNLGDLGAFTLIAFLDAGRVFEQEDFELTTEDWTVGGGGGLALRFLRFTQWVFNFGTGPDGFQFSAGTGWAF
jgi:hypothetical protein